MAQSTVEGFEAFRSQMASAEGSYVVIGGIACDILLSEADLPFRATHDFDTVLIADAGLPEAAKAIWSLVRDGKYRCGWGSDENTCFYRFTEPQTPGFPKMVEVFGKTPDFLGGTTDFEIGPLHIDDEVSSLSAIMLDDAYYQFMLGGVKTVVGISLLDESHLIPFKAKAYLDLKTRKDKGESVDSNKIKKHQRDALSSLSFLRVKKSSICPRLSHEIWLRSYPIASKRKST